MPHLFPIATCAIGVLYVVEKWMLYYAYRVPPMYSEKVAAQMLRQLRVAPLLYLLNAFWMLSNRQLLSNEHLHPITQRGMSSRTDHDLGMLFSWQSFEAPFWPLLVFIALSAFLYFFSMTSTRLLGVNIEKYKEQKTYNLFSLDNYWVALNREDRRWSHKEELNNRNNLQMELLTDDQLNELSESMRKTKLRHWRQLTQVHSYDLLANPHYCEQFLYISAEEAQREQINALALSDQGSGG